MNDNDNEYYFIEHKYIQRGLQSELNYIIVMFLYYMYGDHT